MRLSLIAAVANNHCIGKQNTLPWKLPPDMKYFKETTTGHIVIMGRKTFESMDYRPLPNRTNIVISSTLKDNPASKLHVVTSIEQALWLADALSAPNGLEVFVIGGGEIYRQTIALATKLYITEVDIDVEKGDAFFPMFSVEDWERREVGCGIHASAGREAIGYTFVVYDKK